MTDQDRQTENATVSRADTAVLRITIGATLAALALSFRNQVDFATQRGGYAWWGAILWALIIDTPVIVGELRLYSAASRTEPHPLRIKAWAWTLTICGLIVSMSAGAAHVVVPPWLPVKVLAAVIPPLMAAASLGTGLGIVKLRNRPPTERGDAQPEGRTQPRSDPTTRARRPGKAATPVLADLIAKATADAQQGLPMGWISFQKRHGGPENVSEHYARQAVKAGRAAAGNGAGQATEPVSG